MKPCRNLITALGALVIFQGLAQAAAPGGGKAYRWVDKNGVVHIGDSVPPEYASQGRAELNAQGVPMRETPRQLSPAEEAAARQAEAEEAKRRQRDASLLSTYTRVKDIEQLRDERLALIDGQLEIARASLSATAQRLAGLSDRMRNFAPYSSAPNARRLPDQLAEEVIRALKEQRSLEEILASRESEKNQLRAQFDADIARYRELTARPATH
jgi:hypothetical protein